MADRLLPDWLDAYMIYTSLQRSPDEFHIWVAMSAISGALRRKCYFDHQYFMLYPNLYVVLISPPGRCKKTTAMAIGRRMLSEVAGVNFSTESVSRERFILDMSVSLADGHSSMTAYCSEFASLLSTSKMDMLVFLTDIYDCPPEWTHKTKGGGPSKIVAPYLNLLGGITPDLLAETLPQNAQGIGMTARIVFVYSDTPRIRPVFPKMTKEHKELHGILIKDLSQIAQISGQYTIDPETEKFYEEWELKNQEGRTRHDPRLYGYYERKPQHLLKVAMLLAASKRDETTITIPDLERGLKILDATEATMAQTFSAVGKNPLNLDMHNVAHAIVSEPKIGYAKLFGMFRHSVRKDEMDEVLSALVSIGDIKVVQESDGPHYLPSEQLLKDYE